MTICRKAFAIASSLAIFAGAAAGCLCVGHDEAAHSAHHHVEAGAPDDHHYGPTPRDGSGSGHSHDHDSAPADPCCCSGQDHQLAVSQPVSSPTDVLSSIAALPAVEAGPRADRLRPKEYPPPTEGFKAWPDVALFLQHSALII